jgi:hypothetical protein
MSGYLPGVPSTPVALGDQGVKLARAHLNDGKFAGDKKPLSATRKAMASSLRKITPGSSQTTVALPASTVSTALMETPVAYAVAKWTFMQ